MVIRAAPLPGLPEPPIVIEAINRPRIRVTVVELSDFRGHGG
jgi:hypothetical protein